MWLLVTKGHPMTQLRSQDFLRGGGGGAKTNFTSDS